MQPFAYHRPASLAEAASLIGGEAALLAGGHTLIPAMKARLRAPSALVDLGAVPGLAAITVADGTVTIGAMVRHAELAADSAVRSALPALAETAGLVGDPAVRARGTLGGALANNDPAADYPAAVLALSGEILTNERTIAADDFFQGMFATALGEREIIAAVRLPALMHAAYAKFRHPASRYAMAGVFVARHPGGVRVAVTGAGIGGVFRWTAAEAALARDFSPAAAIGLEPDPSGLVQDIHASADYRAHLVGVMLGRAVAAAQRS